MFKAIACALTAVIVLSLSTSSFAGAKDITDAEYEAEVAKSKLPVVLMFWARFCEDCWNSAEAVDALANEYAGRVKVLTMNVVVNKESAARFEDPENIPVYFYIEGGRVLSSARGLLTKEEIKKQLGLPEK